MKKDKGEILYTRSARDVTFSLLAKKGIRKYNFDDAGKDRLFFIMLEENDPLAYKYPLKYAVTFNEQLELLKLVIDNKILSGARQQYIQKVRDLLIELESKNFVEVIPVPEPIKLKKYIGETGCMN